MGKSNYVDNLHKSNLIFGIRLSNSSTWTKEKITQTQKKMFKIVLKNKPGNSLLKKKTCLPHPKCFMGLFEEYIAEGWQRSRNLVFWAQKHIFGFILIFASLNSFLSNVVGKFILLLQYVLVIFFSTLIIYSCFFHIQRLSLLFCPLLSSCYFAVRAFCSVSSLSKR